MEAKSTAAFDARSIDAFVKFECKAPSAVSEWFVALDDGAIVAGFFDKAKDQMVICGLDTFTDLKTMGEALVKIKTTTPELKSAKLTTIATTSFTGLGCQTLTDCKELAPIAGHLSNKRDKSPGVAMTHELTLFCMISLAHNLLDQRLRLLNVAADTRETLRRQLEQFRKVVASSEQMRWTGKTGGRKPETDLVGPLAALSYFGKS